MAENLQVLRSRIKSVKNTRKLTQAMKTVSAAKLGRSVTELKRIRPVMERIQSMLGKVSRTGNIDHPFLENREPGEVLIVAISSDKGLCGAFNSHIIEKTQEYYRQLDADDEHPSLVTVGNNIYKFFKKRANDYHIIEHYDQVMSGLSHADAKELSTYLQEIYIGDSAAYNFKRIDCLYTEFESASRQAITMKQLFPLEAAWQREEADEDSPSTGNGDKEKEKNEKGNINTRETRNENLPETTEDKKDEETEYIFEPSAKEIFKKLLPMYIDSMVYRILQESSASEHAARMVAMDLATRNAGEMISSLTLRLNKLRQASITNELLEIITATEALKK